WKRRKPGYYIVPFLVAWKSRSFEPLLGDTQTPGPIRQLECRIPGFARRMIFLRRYHWRPQDISQSGPIEEGIRSHEFRRFEHDLAVPLESRSIVPGPIAEFGIEDRMRLLPDQQRADRRGAVVAIGASHLGPSGSSVALLPCPLAGGRQHF